jgi:TM2 domain-containing membrane protein YozV
MVLITGFIHLVATTRAIEMSVLLAVLFVLNGLGFLGGAALYLTRFWRREMFLVAAVYSVVTILALFPFRGWGIEAFYMNGAINPIVVITKAAEAVLAVVSVSLYRSAGE